MTDDGRKAAAAEELARAREEVTAAEHLIRVGLPRIAMTRVYFAAFHAVRAVLFAEGFEPRTHRGAHQLFSRHFVKTGRVPAAASRVAARLQKYREEADYAEDFVVDEQGAREELDAARDLVETLATLVPS